MKKLILFLLFSNAAVAQTIYLPNIKGTLTGTVNGSHNAADVNVVGGGFSGAVDQGNKGTVAQSWYVQPCDGTNCQGFLSTGEGKVSVTQPLPAGSNSIGSVAQSGTWTTGRTWSLLNSTDSVNSVQSGTWTTGRTWNLSSGTDSVTVSGTTSITGTVNANVTSSVLPTGAATESSLLNVVTNTSDTASEVNTANTTLSSINGKFGSLGQKTMSGSTPVVIASDQSAIQASQSGSWSVAQSGTWNVGITAPSGFSSTGGSSSSQQSFTSPGSTKYLLVQADPANTDNIRFGSVSTSTTVGMVLAPGQDSGLMPFGPGATVFVSPVSGTQKVNITWLF